MDVVDFAKHVYNKLHEREEELTSALVVGTPKDWEAYKTIVGEIQGLSFAQDAIRTLLENSSYDDDGFDESG